MAVVFFPLIFLSLGLTGCATYKPQPINPTASAVALETRGLNDPGLTKFLQKADPTGHDWTLERLTLVGLYERPDILIAENQKLLAKSSLQTAKALPNPTLSLTPTYNATNLMPSPGKIGPIFSFMLSSLRSGCFMQAAQAHLAAAKQALPIAAWMVRSQVRTAMLNLWTARQSEAFDMQAHALAQQSVALIAARVNAGQMSEADQNTAILTAGQSALVEAAATRRVTIARAQLAKAIGLPTTSLANVKISFAGFAHPEWPTDIKKLQENALTSRPDIQVALDNYAVAEAQLRLAILQQYPGISIGPGYEYDQGANKYLLSLSISLPIFNQNQGGIAKAYAEREIAGARFLSTQQSVLDSIGQAVANERASAAEVKAADALLKSVKEQKNHLEQQYNGGSIGKLR
uniref:TolC n=1 Tax=Acidiphilium symbioticum TaxID=94005 RepID=A1Z2Y2_9PROT|nr:TolC [Acidiphilium symbioticum]